LFGGGWGGGKKIKIFFRRKRREGGATISLIEGRKKGRVPLSGAEGSAATKPLEEDREDLEGKKRG